MIFKIIKIIIQESQINTQLKNILFDFASIGWGLRNNYLECKNRCTARTVAHKGCKAFVVGKGFVGDDEESRKHFYNHTMTLGLCVFHKSLFL